jgi:hypothetical protein
VHARIAAGGACSGLSVREEPPSFMPILAFPSRYALLVRAWSFEHASGAIAIALGISADRLSKMASGETKNLNNRASGPTFVQKLADHLEGTGLLAERGVDKATFTARFGASDDLEFIQFVAESRSVPVPPSVRALPRRNAQNLFRRLGGLCFLYRLGVEERNESVRGGRLIKELPVLRRMPAVIEDINEGYLRYRDSYGWYGEDFEVASATGFVFYIKDHFTILAEDSEAGGISELFLAELRQDAIRVEGDTGGGLYEGVMLMRGDTAVPTACKVLFRQASAAMQKRWESCRTEEDWQALARSLERKFYLEDNDKDGVFEFAAQQNPRSSVETTDMEPFSGLKYSWYANKLQIRNFKLEIR